MQLRDMRHICIIVLHVVPPTNTVISHISLDAAVLSFGYAWGGGGGGVHPQVPLRCCLSYT